MATVCAGDTSMRIVYNIRVMSTLYSAYLLICGVKCYDNDNSRNKKIENGITRFRKDGNRDGIAVAASWILKGN